MGGRGGKGGNKGNKGGQAFLEGANGISNREVARIRDVFAPLRDAHGALARLELLLASGESVEELHSMTFNGREFKAFFDVALDQGARLELTEGVRRREEERRGGGGEGGEGGGTTRCVVLWCVLCGVHCVCCMLCTVWYCMLIHA